MELYILKCSDESYYTGITNNLERRLNEHKFGLDKKSYTYSRRPVDYVFTQQFNDPNDAIMAEKQVKGWSRAKKEALIENRFDLIKSLSECKNITNHLNHINQKS